MGLKCRQFTLTSYLHTQRAGRVSWNTSAVFLWLSESHSAMLSFPSWMVMNISLHFAFHVSSNLADLRSRPATIHNSNHSPGLNRAVQKLRHRFLFFFYMYAVGKMKCHRLTPPLLRHWKIILDNIHGWHKAFMNSGNLQHDIQGEDRLQSSCFISMQCKWLIIRTVCVIINKQFHPEHQWRSLAMLATARLTLER